MNKLLVLKYDLRPEKIKYIIDEIKIKYPIIPTLEAMSRCNWCGCVEHLESNLIKEIFYPHIFFSHSL